MDPRYEVVAALNAELLREADDRRRAARQAPCRQRVLGLPIGRPCETASAR